MGDSGVKIGPQEIDDFRKSGFVVLPGFTTADDVARIRALLLELYRRFPQLPARLAIDLGDEGWHDEAPQIPEINWTMRLAPALARTLALRRGRLVATRLLGRPAEPTGFDHAILKPPHNDRETPWHQDAAYCEASGPCGSVHVWIPLQDVTLEMGCMEFVPGSHLGPVLPHHRRGHRPTAHALEAEGVDRSRAVPCPLRAGDATVHLPRTLHRTGPNRSGTPRLAWILEFGARRGPLWRRWLRRR